MADQKLGLEINTTSNVPQQLDKAKSSVVSFSKQVEDVQKKFSTAFKDAFLAFAAPMVIINNLVGFITDSINKSKQQAQEGLDLMAKGETMYATMEEKKMAAFFKAKAATQKEKEEVEKGKAEFVKQFAGTESGSAAMNKFLSEGNNRFLVTATQTGPHYGMLYQNKEFQKRMVEEFLKTPEGKAYEPIFENKKDNNFKSPEGVNSVVGMGSNAAMQAMLDSLEEQRKQTYLLEQIAQSGGTLPSDFTKTTTAAPSRSYLLTK